jgi:hypothetical protein
MASHDAVSALEEVFRYIDENADGDDDIPDARALFRDHMASEGGEIDVLEPPRIYHESAADLAERTLFDSWYGVDASTMPPKKFRNGMVVSAAVASGGALGNCDEGVEELETLIAAVHAEFEAVDSPIDLIEGDVSLTLVPIEESPARSELGRWVSASARIPAECWHSERLADVIDGPLFLDGSLYPMSVLPFVNMSRTSRGSDDDGIEFKEIERMGAAASAIQSRVNAINTLASRGLPTLGFTKTFRSDDVVESLSAKTENVDDTVQIPWDDDSQFVSALLADDEPDHLTFTSWLVRSHQRVYGNDLEPLGGFEMPGDREARDFRRAFFFVRLPDNIVLRVEAPLMLVDTREGRLRHQQLALAHIAEADDVPFAIKRADDRARISREARRHLVGLIRGTEEVGDYNTKRRWGLGGGPSLAREPDIVTPDDDSSQSDEEGPNEEVTDESSTEQTADTNATTPNNE